MDWWGWRGSAGNKTKKPVYSGHTPERMEDCIGSQDPRRIVVLKEEEEEEEEEGEED